jgi:segregation and condensation protein A
MSQSADIPPPPPTDAPGGPVPNRWKQLPLGLMNEYRVKFEVFDGPLDLLLHLVKKQEVDIYQVNLTQIATEFVAYVDQMRELDLEVAGEFLVMAATLLYLKSRELLPVEQRVEPATPDDDEADPRFELIRRLVEYKKFKDVAARLQDREGDMDRIYERRPGRVELADTEPARRDPVSVFDLVEAVSTILKRFHERDDVREIHADPHTVSEKMEQLRTLLGTRPSFRFSELFAAARSRAEVVVTFLAMLELTRLRQLVLSQNEDFGEIEVAGAPPAPPVEPENTTGQLPNAETTVTPELSQEASPSPESSGQEPH